MTEIDELMRAQIIAGIRSVADRLQDIEKPYPPQDRGKDASILRNILAKI